MGNKIERDGFSKKRVGREKYFTSLTWSDMAKKNDPGFNESSLIGRLRAEVRGCGLSLNELTRRSGVSTPQLSRFVKGERSLTLPAAEKLADYFRLELVKTAGEPLPAGKAEVPAKASMKKGKPPKK